MRLAACGRGSLDYCRQLSRVGFGTCSIPPVAQFNSLYIVVLIHISGWNNRWTQSLVHLAFDAELFGKDDHNDGRGGHNEPKEKREGQGARVVRGEDKVDKNKGKAKIKDHPWFPNDGVEEVDTASDK